MTEAAMMSRTIVPDATAPKSRSMLLVPMALTVLFLGFILLPPVRDKPRLIATFAGVAGVLFIWELLLWARARRRGQALLIQPFANKAHYIQASVQFCIYVYWGWYSRGIYAEAPLIVSQIVFLYVFDALLSWTRGRPWRLGFGPLPIIFSTNLLLWFRHDWYIFQFLMVATGALGKEFVKWTRDGRRTHIFNPSVFGQSLFAVVLIATGLTTKLTMGEELALTFETMGHLRHMFLLLFVLGLTVQSFFPVVLMTFSATAMLWLLNVVYTQATGTYYFITLNIGATVFLGLHLLMTDPSTSPRTYLGRVIFGALYGVGYFVLYGLLTDIGAPLFWDKLLPVPFLNVMVPLIDRAANSGAIGKLNRWWQTSFRPARANLVHMGAWAVFFTVLLSTGFIGGTGHPGYQARFWKQAYDEGRHLAGTKLLTVVMARMDAGSGEAFNMMGLLQLEGKLVAKNPAAAADSFARACEVGYSLGCENLAGQFLFEHRARSPADVARALDHLEQTRSLGADGASSFLVGAAYELGQGRPLDRARALQFYDDGCKKGNQDACRGFQRLTNGAGNRTPLGQKETPESRAARELIEQARRAVDGK